MNCPDCDTKGEYKRFETFAYWYCKRCKTEIEVKQPEEVMSVDEWRQTFEEDDNFQILKDYDDDLMEEFVRLLED